MDIFQIKAESFPRVKEELGSYTSVFIHGHAQTYIQTHIQTYIHTYVHIYNHSFPLWILKQVVVYSVRIW